MAYKPNTWVITTQKRETYVLADLEKITAHYNGDESLTDIAMGENSTEFEVYKTDENGLRCDPNFPHKTFNTICAAATFYQNMLYAEKRGYKQELLCPICGAYLGDSIGTTSEAYQLMRRGGSFDSPDDYSDVKGYYCPDCGQDLPYQVGSRIADYLASNDEE